MDAADKDKKIATPTLILWGARGPERSNEFINVWRRYGANMQGQGLPSGHYMPEEIPDLLYEQFTRFFMT
jgi:haloacetate dehalogenase